MESLRNIKGCIAINEKGAWNKRFTPTGSLHQAARLFNQMGGSVLIEIGTGIHGEMSGNSILVWAEKTQAKRIIAVDLEQRCLDQVREATKRYENVEAVLANGVDYIRDFSEPIDMLYLDFWTPDPSGKIAGTGRAESYRDVFEAAKDKLSSRSLILIDDTDHVHPWKHTYIVPLAREQGYRVLYIGRQTLLQR